MVVYRYIYTIYTLSTLIYTGIYIIYTTYALSIRFIYHRRIVAPNYTFIVCHTLWALYTIYTIYIGAIYLVYIFYIYTIYIRWCTAYTLNIRWAISHMYITCTLIYNVSIHVIYTNDTARAYTLYIHLLSRRMLWHVS